MEISVDGSKQFFVFILQSSGEQGPSFVYLRGDIRECTDVYVQEGG
jgi:hypothetical protein